MGKHRWRSDYAQGVRLEPVVYLTEKGDVVRRVFDGNGAECIGNVGRPVSSGKLWPSKWSEVTGVGE